ncbi:hypothetical protein SDJN03_19696, partial [Cucurbita argyrosperma subsp. sororia]
MDSFSFSSYFFLNETVTSFYSYLIDASVYVLSHWRGLMGLPGPCRPLNFFTNSCGRVNVVEPRAREGSGFLLSLSLLLNALY